ncbi:Yip1 family protein [Paracoccus siganidrum]|uniref:YIP1 family protein n=1 Tax=Paracoccus siganidrum TaxID=1276757 RepID=A0A419A7Z5_9RHOB|nr:Yip1 family protein [Paracoccus siganidrum]RJL18058.1 YIP1 family protein [Paracoccus siganidrum]RMC40443.1 YIP1 family protein [Paracoccus siganidrum]
MTNGDLKSLLVLTLRDPAQVARLLIGLGLPMSARWMALLLAVSVSGLLAWLAGQIAPVPEELRTPFTDAISQPFAMAGMQFAAITVAAALMAAVGRVFGGQGRFEDALLLTVWIEVVLLVVQALQILMMLVLPALTSMLGIAAIVLFFWLTVQFTKELHGFTSSFKVFVGLIATAFALGFVLSILAASFGLLPEMPQ